MENQTKKEAFKKLRDENLDLAIVAKGGISLYHNLTLINSDIQLLASKGFKIIEFDDRVVTTKTELHWDLQEKLGFPGYYGKNFDALNDCLRDYEVTSPGHVLVFKKLDHLDHQSIYHLLDVFALHCRRNCAIGRKLLLLVQVDNRNFSIKEPIGSLNFWLWNDQEWSVSNRHE
jgi:RNAse (barnase) inhibitor barstar